MRKKSETRLTLPFFSPDGHWIGFFIEGLWPHYVKWSADGRELFYRRGASVMGVRIGDDPGATKPEKLFEGEYGRSVGEKSWDVAPDGRFLMKKLLRAEYSINVVLNWQEELKQKVPTR